MHVSHIYEGRIRYSCNDLDSIPCLTSHSVPSLWVSCDLEQNVVQTRQNITGKSITLLLSLPFEDVAARIYGQIRHALRAAGQAIGLNNTMIAAIGLVHNLIVVTHNTSEFSRVPGLSLEDWQIP